MCPPPPCWLVATYHPLISPQHTESSMLCLPHVPTLQTRLILHTTAVDLQPPSPCPPPPESLSAPLHRWLQRKSLSLWGCQCLEIRASPAISLPVSMCDCDCVCLRGRKSQEEDAEESQRQTYHLLFCIFGRVIDKIILPLFITSCSVVLICSCSIQHIVSICECLKL